MFGFQPKPDGGLMKKDYRGRMKKQAVMIVIKKADKYLLGKRSFWKEKAPGYWCPISGHIEQNECEEDAVKREAAEEIGVEVKPLHKITSILSHDGTVMLHWWFAVILSGEPAITNNENSELKWFSVLDLQNLEPAFKEDLDILLSVEECN
jgi:8-oxo-dGTP pyrophosphatase MutT (NUDIX family)